MDVFIIFRLFILLQVVTAKSKTNQMRSRIYPGHIAKEGQFPYQGYVLVSNNVKTILCGGSIIHQRWALTAAHCIFDFDNATFTVGTIYLNGSEGITHEIEVCYQHSNFYVQDGPPIAAIYDVGLMRTKTDVTYTDRVSAIPLARDTTANYDHQTALMSGWGHSQQGDVVSWVLLYEYVPMMPLNDCYVAAVNYYLNKELHVCASNANQQQACEGDSGSPLVLNGEQIGITSQGDYDCDGSKPTIYTRVSTFVPWIENVLSIFSERI